MTDTAERPAFRYKAFLSYRSADRQRAERLHKAIETFRIPKSLVKAAGKRPGRIFRDRDEARTSDDIESIIAQELSKSEHLIVLCTPAAAKPESWVGREIELFRARRPDGKVHAVIGAGEPPDCFPPQLISVDPAGRPKLPLAADIRTRREGGQDGYRRAVAKLVAGITGLDFDDLWKRAERRRRAVAAAWSSAGVGLLALVGGVYAYAGLSEFVREEGEYLAVYRGLPDLNPPGLPVREWTLTEAASDLELPPGTDPLRAVATARPGEDVLAKLDALMRPDVAGLQLYAAGDDAGARARAIGVMDDSALPFETRVRGGLLFAETATAQDWARLEKMSHSERSEWRLAAVQALFRLDPPKAFAALDHLGGADWQFLHRDLIRMSKAPCSPETARMLELGFEAEGTSPENVDIIDAALRAGCTLSTQALLYGVARTSLSGGDTVMNYAVLTGKAPEMRDELGRMLADPLVADWRIGDLAAAYAVVGGTCGPELARGLMVRLAATRLVVMDAMAKACPGALLSVRAGNAPGVLIFDLTGTEQFDWSETVDLASEDGFYNAEPALAIVLRLNAQEVIAALQAAESLNGDELVRERIFRALTRLGDRTPPSQDLLGSNTLQLRQAAIERDRLIDPEAAADRLMPFLRGEDGFYEGELGRMDLTQRQLENIRAQLGGNAQQRRQAACVLGMQAPADEVVALALNADADIRTRALACAPFNAGADEILEKMPQKAGRFLISGLRGLRDQVGKKRDLQAQLAAMPPELRLWRMEIAHQAASGAGLWGTGMDHWIEEERFRLLNNIR